ncbi:MAG: hypothetical protein IJA75_03055 [Oscillospiraceae bacterium]|nr:hypothetical protein [Oscillospiraceae bacterium]
MDMLTLAMAKAYTDSKYDTKLVPGVLSFDGDVTGREVVTPESGTSLVKILDRPIAESEFLGLTATHVDSNGGTPVHETVSASDLRIEPFFSEGSFSVGTDDGLILVISTPQAVDIEDNHFSAGTWVLMREGDGLLVYTSGIYGVLMEQVTIKPEHLPGVCLPVVELSHEQFNEILEAEGTGGVTYGEGKVFEELEAAFSIGLPCVIRVPVVDAAVASIMSLSLTETDDEAFFVYSGNIAGFSLLAGRMDVQDHVVWTLHPGEGA